MRSLLSRRGKLGFSSHSYDRAMKPLGGGRMRKTGALVFMTRSILVYKGQSAIIVLKGIEEAI